MVELFKLIPFILPLFSVLAIPLSILIATILTFSRMSTDLEITSMKTAGLSLSNIIKPVFLFSCIIFSMALFSSLKLQPFASKYINNRSAEILHKYHTIRLEEGVFNNFYNLLVYINKIRGSSLDGLFISQKTLQGQRIITAKEGKIIRDMRSGNMFIKLYTGNILMENNPDTSNYEMIKFSTYLLRIENSFKATGGIKFFKETWGMGLKEIKERISLEKRRGEMRRYRKLLLEYYKRFSLPISVLILGILGVPLGIKTRFSSKMAGFLVSVLIIFCYYIIDTGFEIIAVEGKISPLIAAWSPNIIALGVTLFALSKVK